MCLTCVTMELRVGHKFRLGRKIGSGSFGDIYIGVSHRCRASVRRFASFFVCSCSQANTSISIVVFSEICSAGQRLCVGRLGCELGKRGDGLGIDGCIVTKSGLPAPSPAHTHTHTPASDVLSERFSDPTGMGIPIPLDFVQHTPARSPTRLGIAK